MLLNVRRVGAMHPYPILQRDRPAVAGDEGGACACQTDLTLLMPKGMPRRPLAIEILGDAAW